jgi:hypothetical protein
MPAEGEIGSAMNAATVSGPSTTMACSSRSTAAAAASSGVRSRNGPRYVTGGGMVGTANKYGWYSSLMSARPVSESAPEVAP